MVPPPVGVAPGPPGVPDAPADAIVAWRPRRPRVQPAVVAPLATCTSAPHQQCRMRRPPLLEVMLAVGSRPVSALPVKERLESAGNSPPRDPPGPSYRFIRVHHPLSSVLWQRTDCLDKTQPVPTMASIVKSPSTASRASRRARSPPGPLCARRPHTSAPLQARDSWRSLIPISACAPALSSGRRFGGVTGVLTGRPARRRARRTLLEGSGAPHTDTFNVTWEQVLTTQEYRTAFRNYLDACTPDTKMLNFLDAVESFQAVRPSTLTYERAERAALQMSSRSADDVEMVTPDSATPAAASPAPAAAAAAPRRVITVETGRETSQARPLTRYDPLAAGRVGAARSSALLRRIAAATPPHPLINLSVAGAQADAKDDRRSRDRSPRQVHGERQARHALRTSPREFR
jgi:hypothetical protein